MMSGWFIYTIHAAPFLMGLQNDCCPLVINSVESIGKTGRSGFVGINADPFTITAKIFIGHNSVNLGIKGIIPPKTDISAWMYFGAQLTNKDISCLDNLAAKPFDTTPLPYTVPSVSGTSACFLMCHDKTSVHYQLF
jgi:hypothetical protein